jgi:hypothetical protein
MINRYQFIICGIFLFGGSSMATRPEQGYFDRFYRPGSLQKSLLAQNTLNKKDLTPLVPLPSNTATNPDSGLSLDTPALGPPPTETGLTAGPFTNLVFGGALDYRFIFPKDMPSGMFMIHVNELFLTTNVGDNISILAEQLLVTSDLGSTVGQDHGFVYATISNLSFLPNGTAIRIGRMRLKYGIDAKLDAPANPLRTMEYRTIGLISDRAIEIAGFFSFLEYSAAVSMGPDFILKNVTTQDGSSASIKTDADNRNHPFIGRVGSDFKGNAPNFGLSYYNGKNYRVLSQDMYQAGDTMIFGGFVDQHFLVQKERESLDLRWGIWKLKFSSEYTMGTDTDSSGQRGIEAYYFRTDYNIVPQKFIAQLQYDVFHDGFVSTRVGAAGLGLTYYLTDSSWIRGFYQTDDKIFSGGSLSSVAGTQFLLAF